MEISEAYDPRSCPLVSILLTMFKDVLWLCSSIPFTSIATIYMSNVPGGWLNSWLEVNGCHYKLNLKLYIRNKMEIRRCMFASDFKYNIDRSIIGLACMYPASMLGVKRPTHIFIYRYNTDLYRENNHLPS